MKKIISTLLIVVLLMSLLSINASANSVTINMSDESSISDYMYNWNERPIYVSLFGTYQSRVNRIWAFSSVGRVSFVQIWDGGHCLKQWERLEPNHEYEVYIRVQGVKVSEEGTGPKIYTNGVYGWSSYSIDDTVQDSYITARYTFTTGKFLW